MKIKTTKGGKIDSKNVEQLSFSNDVLSVKMRSGKWHIIPEDQWHGLKVCLGLIKQSYGGPMGGRGVL